MSPTNYTCQLGRDYDNTTQYLTISHNISLDYIYATASCIGYKRALLMTVVVFVVLQIVAFVHHQLKNAYLNYTGESNALVLTSR